MLTLMKYEFRKQMDSKFIIALFVILFQAYIVFSMATGRENALQNAMGFFIAISSMIIFYMGFENILTYSKDMRTKNSYMLFLTPHSSYTIIGAKVISAGLQILLIGLALFGVFTGNVFLLSNKYESFAELKEMILMIVKFFTSKEITTKEMGMICLLLLLSWLLFVVVSFLSITFATTLLANKKWKGLFSGAIFVAIFYIFGKVMNFVMNTYTKSLSVEKLQTVEGAQSAGEIGILIYMGITLVFIVVSYFATSYLLEKKVSL